MGLDSPASRARAGEGGTERGVCVLDIADHTVLDRLFPLKLGSRPTSCNCFLPRGPSGWLPYGLAVVQGLSYG